MSKTRQITAKIRLKAEHWRSLDKKGLKINWEHPVLTQDTTFLSWYLAELFLSLG